MATLDTVDFALHLPAAAAASLTRTRNGVRSRSAASAAGSAFTTTRRSTTSPACTSGCSPSSSSVTRRASSRDLLGEALRDAKVKPAELTALDFGAGNGMVGELLDELSIGDIVGIDLLPEARDAAAPRPSGPVPRLPRARPHGPRARASGATSCATTSASWPASPRSGFGDIPPLAFAEAFNLVGSPGWVAFNIRDRFLEEETGFGGFIARMLREGVIDERARKRYVHRRSVSGDDARVRRDRGRASAATCRWTGRAAPDARARPGPT